MKIKQFFQSETVAAWDIDDLHENRAGRLSASQRRMIQLLLYQFATSGIILLGIILLVLFIVAILVIFSGREDFRQIMHSTYLIAGILIPLWFVFIYGHYGIALLQDMRAGIVQQDCGLARLETRRLPPRFRLRHYVILDERRYELSPLIFGDIHDQQPICIYYAPQTHLALAVTVTSRDANI